jgi:hypothetical protein
MIPSELNSKNALLDHGSQWLGTKGKPVAACVAIAIIIAVSASASRQSSLRPEGSGERTVVMSRGQWKVPIESVKCLSRSSTRKTMILGSDYSDYPDVLAEFGKSFGGLPIRVDDPSCQYVTLTAISTHDRTVQLRGQPALILTSVGICEWGGTPQTIDPNRCSQKNVWFFRGDVEPLELVATTFKAFVEPQDRKWKVFHDTTNEMRESCTSTNMQSIFFPPDNAPDDEPIVQTTIVDLIRPEDWSGAKIGSTPPQSSLYAVAHVDKVLKGAIWKDATALFVNASVGRCVHPLKVGDAGILVGSANDVSGGTVRFFPRLNMGL